MINIFFFNDAATAKIYTLSLHDALPIFGSLARRLWTRGVELDRRLGAYVIAEACAGLHAAHELKDEQGAPRDLVHRSEEHTSELQSQSNLVCRLLLEKKKNDKST